MLLIVIVAFLMILGVFVLFGIVSAVSDAVRRRKEGGPVVLADSEEEFEEDVGRPREPGL